MAIAAEHDSGNIFLPRNKCVDPLILDAILQANNPFPCNTVGKTDLFTTDPYLTAISDEECITYFSQEDLKDLGCDSLFGALVGADGEYSSMRNHLNPCFLSVNWSEGNQEDVEKAIANYLDAAPSQADIDESLFTILCRLILGRIWLVELL